MAVGGNVWEERLRVWIETRGDKDFNRVVAGMKGYITRLQKQLKSSETQLDKFRKGMMDNKRAFSMWLGTGLSVMFLAQGIAAALKSMMQPALELVGAFDVWRMILISLLTSSMIPFVEWLIDMFNYLEQHPGIKKFLAKLIIVGYIFAKVLAIVSQFAILIAGLKYIGASALTGILTWASIVFVFVLAILDVLRTWKRPVVTFLKILGIIAAVIIGVILLPAEASAVAVGAVIAGLSLLFVAIVDLFTAVYDYIVKNWSSIIDWFKNNWARYLTRILLMPFMPVLEIIKYIMKFLDRFAGTHLMNTSFGKLLEFATFAEGGIVTRPTLALLGERGPEAVVPLAGGGGPGGFNVVININGGNFGSMAQANNVVRMIQSALRDELRRLGVR